MNDILITGAIVVDGTGNPGFEADVAVADGMITRIGKADGKKAKTIIDARGCVVAPGFIDMHSHADFSLPVLPTADSLVRQGITTVVAGQCGLSPAPLPEKNREDVAARLAATGGEDMGLPWDQWTSFGDYLGFLRRLGISVNVVPVVGQGTLRAGVMGFGSGRATERQMKLMQAEAAKAIAEGAVGLSTGLIYPPGSYACTEELVELTRVVGELGGFYFSHIRGESETLLDAVAEAIRIGRSTGAPVEISHFKAAGKRNWDLSARALKLIDEAREGGADIGVDMYPYTAGSTGLPFVLPEWAHEGGKEETLKRLKDPDVRRKMTEDMKTAGFARSTEWDAVLITGSPKNTRYQGRFVADLAGEAGKTPYAWIFDALFETGLEIAMAIFAMSEENRRKEMQHPLMTFCTDGYGLAVDGLMSDSLPHPRSYGSFPRVLGRYVREEKVLTLEGAVHKMTGLAAARLRFTDRGLVKPGQFADLVVFDPAAIRDAATFENPHRYAEGIRAVMVNGELVVHDEKHTGCRSGRVLGRIPKE